MAQNVVVEKMLSFALSLVDDFAVVLRPPEMNSILKAQSVFTL